MTSPTNLSSNVTSGFIATGRGRFAFFFFACFISATVLVGLGRVTVLRRADFHDDDGALLLL